MHSETVRLRRIVGPGLLALALVVPLLGNPDSGIASSKGALAGFTGAPGEDTCRHCHDTFPINLPGGYLTIDGFPETYVPRETYTVTITLVSANASKWGFQATTLNEKRKRSGTFVVTDKKLMKVEEGLFFPGRHYLMQKRRGSYENQTGMASWTFDWRAPKRPKGPITLYVSANAANANGEISGDRIYYLEQTTRPEGEPESLAGVIDRFVRLIERSVRP